jgi:hypothetical protein
MGKDERAAVNTLLSAHGLKLRASKGASSPGPRRSSRPSPPPRAPLHLVPPSPAEPLDPATNDPEPPASAAAISLTSNQWAELERLASAPQVTWGSLRTVVQAILAERGCAVIYGKGDAERCRITKTGRVRYKAGRNGAPSP